MDFYRTYSNIKLRIVVSSFFVLDRYGDNATKIGYINLNDILDTLLYILLCMLTIHSILHSFIYSLGKC